MPGPPPVPRNKRQRRNKDEGTTSTTVDLAAAGSTELTRKPPRCPAGMSTSTQRVWREFWTSPIATQLEVSDLPLLRRWITLVELESRLSAEVLEEHTHLSPIDDEPYKLAGHLSFGSQGQLVEHPNMKLLLKVDAEMRAIEDRLGGSPMARFRLGWQKGEMVSSLGRANEAGAIAAVAADIAKRHADARRGES